MREYICEDTDLLVRFIQRLTELTKEGKIYWTRDDSGNFYTQDSAISKFSFSVTKDKCNIDKIVLYFDGRCKAYTKEICMFWQDLLRLYMAVKSNVSSVSFLIKEMLEDLNNR